MRSIGANLIGRASESAYEFSFRLLALDPRTRQTFLDFFFFAEIIEIFGCIGCIQNWLYFVQELKGMQKVFFFEFK